MDRRRAARCCLDGLDAANNQVRCHFHQSPDLDPQDYARSRRSDHNTSSAIPEDWALAPSTAMIGAITQICAGWRGSLDLDLDIMPPYHLYLTLSNVTGKSHKTRADMF